MTAHPQAEVNKLHAARLQLVRRRPYLATALWAMQVVERPGLGTLAVDERWRLYVDPAVPYSVEELSGILYHEILHLLRDHARRAKAMNAQPRAWNVAVDLEVNDDLIDEGVTLPSDGLFPQKLGLPPYRTAEEYYQLLQQQQQCRGGGGNGNDREERGSPAPGAGNCGSAADGERRPWEESGDGSGSGAQQAAPGISHAEAELIRRKVAEDIRTAASKSRGTVPAHLARWAEAVLQPKVDWRRVLAGMVRAALSHVSGAVDYTYSRPSRRQHTVGNVVLPALRRPAPEVAVIVDTSGSMGSDELARALAEVRGVLRSAGVTGATVLSVDAAVHTCQRVFDVRQVKLVGGGGTDMGVGIEKALTLRPRPQVVIVLTDGYTPWPKSPPPVRVVVGVIGNGPEPPAWARCVRIKL